jgi:hypothetical protein
MTPHNAQGWTRAGTGEVPVAGGMGKPASVVAHHKNQSRNTGPLKPDCRLIPLLALHLPGLRASAFYPRTAGGRCIGIQRRRLVASPPGRPAAALQFMPAVLASGSQLRFSDHVPAKFADRFEAHACHSKSVGFNANRHMRGNVEPCSVNQPMRFSQ